MVNELAKQHLPQSSDPDIAFPRQAVVFAHRTGTSVAVLMVDLDRFKNVNDFVGHNVGDRLLEAVATRLQVNLRESDIVARIGETNLLSSPLSSLQAVMSRRWQIR